MLVASLLSIVLNNFASSQLSPPRELSQQVYKISILMLAFSTKFKVLELFSQIFLYGALHVNKSSLATIQQKITAELARVHQAVSQNQRARRTIYKTLHTHICALSEAQQQKDEVSPNKGKHLLKLIEMLSCYDGFSRA